MFARDFHRACRGLELAFASSVERHAHDKSRKLFRVRLTRDTSAGTIAVEAVCDTYEAACDEALASMRAILHVAQVQARGGALLDGDPPPREPTGPGAR